MAASEITIPVGGINDIALPSPSRFHRMDGQVCNYADASAGGALLHGRPDPQVKPDQWELHWDDVPSATVNAIRAHFRDFGAGTWLWIRPERDGSGVPIVGGVPTPVIYLEGPEITWNHRTASASARVVIERAIAL